MPADLRDWLLPMLCETCKAINFESLAADTESTRSSRRATGAGIETAVTTWRPDTYLGSLAEVISRTNRCNLCKLIAKVLPRRKLPKYSDFKNVSCGISLESYAQCDLSGELVDLNRFNITIVEPPRQTFPQTILSLQACRSPIPSVAETEVSQLEGLLAALDLDPLLSRLKIPSGRLIDPYINLKLVQQWISLCQNDHGEACRQPRWIIAGEKQHSRLRVLDLHECCVVEAPPNCDYFALSYVWGPPSDILRLLVSNEDELCEPGGIDWSNERLPKTIRDAVGFVYHLGYRYLWVDSLCIIQDDEVDMASQIAYMDSIYAMAIVTIIAADGSHANHGLAGWTENPRDVHQLTVKVSERMSLMEHVHLLTGTAYDKCVWKTRGWTFQEQLCSRRKLLLTADQAFWICSKADWCETISLECFPEVKVTSKTAMGNAGLLEEPPSGMRPFDLPAATWVLGEYLRRSLTNQGDALNAISAYLYRLYQCHPFGQNVWGHLVIMRFDESLAWSCVDGLKRRKHKVNPNPFDPGTSEQFKIPFPSWSWVGWEGNPRGWSIFPSALGIIKYELEFYFLDLDGRVKEFMTSRVFRIAAKYMTKPDISRLSGEPESKWKGETHIDADEFPDDAPFRDSGHLLFWTSKADLFLKFEAAYPEIDPLGQQLMNCYIIQEDGTKVGELATSEFPDTMGDSFDGIGTSKSKYSFVIVSRKYLEGQQLIATAELNILILQWEDEEKCIASRVNAGTVSEDAWIKCEREWIKLTLT